jgi:hypothetical protein
MSGGALNYAYHHIDDITADIVKQATRFEHRALATHLIKVAKALHDLEWVLSGDYAEGDEIPAINEVLRASDVLDAAREQAQLALVDLKRALGEPT